MALGTRARGWRTALGRQRYAVAGGLAVVSVLLAAPPDAAAQLDPLLFLQRNKPNVVVAMDAANRMLRDAADAYYDPYTYTKTSVAWEALIGVNAANTTSRYRRKYVSLAHLDGSVNNDRFKASTIVTAGDQTSGFASFWSPTRLGVARAGVLDALQRNTRVARFGLVRTRQDNPRIVSEKNEGPVWVEDEAQQGPTESSSTNGRWKITRPVVDSTNGSVSTTSTPLVKADSATANETLAALLAKDPDQAGAILPAGRDSKNDLDAPLASLLADARTEAARLISADTACRNTVVILVAGGGEGTTSLGADPAATASTFLNVSGRRVPVYVIAIVPPATAVAQLTAIAQNSGGAYVEITQAMIDAAPAGTSIPEFTRAMNAAVQHTFAAQADFDTAPTALLPLGPSTESQTASPIVGTVNLEGGHDIAGTLLTNTRVLAPSGTVVPQRSNVLVTAGMALPGFEGRLRAFRMYVPEADASKPYGWAFVAAGTRLWVSALPAPDQRNIYTSLPDGTMVPLTTARAADLAPYLNTSDAASLITFVRQQPLGAVIGSTPAFLDPPSLDPPPDPAYATFATNLTERRTLIFIGANDGMLHAFDARSGLEVWAFVPFNLLPKLRALRDGQAVGSFTYFMDSSPKISDIKVGSEWRTYLIVGEGPGGTFYQALDVTLSALPAAVPSSSDDTGALLSFFSQSDRIPLRWSFPSLSNFDATIAPYGDVRAGASAIEKSVGETWSDPAVGQVSATSEFVALVGSGFLARSRELAANRGGTAAGTTLYLLSMVDGSVLDSRDVGNDGLAETIDNCAVTGDCSRVKNALQADPVATGPYDSRFINKAYLGDLDGRVWRFDIGLGVSDRPAFTSAARKLFDATALHPIFSSMASVSVGGTQDYLFFASGSDMLPSNGVDQEYKLFGILDSAGTGALKLELELEETDGEAGDEKPSAFPAVAGDIVFFSTTTFRPATPCTAPSGNLYALTFVGGAAYDTTGDGRITRSDSAKVRTVSNGRATAPFAVDQHLVFASGDKVELLGDPRDFNNGVGQIGVRILSWRERR